MSTTISTQSFTDSTTSKAASFIRFRSIIAIAIAMQHTRSSRVALAECYAVVSFDCQGDC